MFPSSGFKLGTYLLEKARERIDSASSKEKAIATVNTLKAQVLDLTSSMKEPSTSVQNYNSGHFQGMLTEVEKVHQLDYEDTKRDASMLLNQIVMHACQVGERSMAKA
eukprot:1954983-Pyramimonas_sp.AAC.1